MFTEEDAKGVSYPHYDALIIKANLGGTEVERMLVDPGSAVDIISKETLDGLGVEFATLMEDATPLFGFGGSTIVPLGRVQLTMTLETGPHSRIIMLDFAVVDCLSSYRTIEAMVRSGNHELHGDPAEDRMERLEESLRLEREDARKDREVTQTFLKGMMEMMESLERKAGDQAGAGPSRIRDLGKGKMVAGEGESPGNKRSGRRVRSMIVAGAAPEREAWGQAHDVQTSESFDDSHCHEGSYPKKYPEQGGSPSKERYHPRRDEGEVARGMGGESAESQMKDWFKKEKRKWEKNVLGSSRGAQETETASPFTKEVLEAEFPRRFPVE